MKALVNTSIFVLSMALSFRAFAASHDLRPFVANSGNYVLASSEVAYCDSLANVSLTVDARAKLVTLVFSGGKAFNDQSTDGTSTIPVGRASYHDRRYINAVSGRTRTVIEDTTLLNQEQDWSDLLPWFKGDWQNRETLIRFVDQDTIEIPFINKCIFKRVK